MKIKLLTAFLGLLILTAAPISNAQVGITFGFNSCGYPGYYESCPVYGPPVGVYLGGGEWGGGWHDHRGGGRGGHRR